MPNGTGIGDSDNIPIGIEYVKDAVRTFRRARHFIDESTPRLPLNPKSLRPGAPAAELPACSPSFFYRIGIRNAGDVLQMNQPSTDAGCLSEHLARAPWLRCGTNMFRETLVITLPERSIGRKTAGRQHNAAANIDAAAQTGACVFHYGSCHRNAVISFSCNEMQEFFIDLKLSIQCPCSVQKRHHQCRRTVARHNGGSRHRLFDF